MIQALREFTAQKCRQPHMKRKRHNGEEILKKSRAIGEELEAGKRDNDATRSQSISLATCQRWKS
jgi:hypothetical protein